MAILVDQFRPEIVVIRTDANNDETWIKINADCTIK
jgi:hypothetical protein